MEQIFELWRKTSTCAVLLLGRLIRNRSSLPPLKEQARTCSGCRLMVGRQFVSSTSFLITPLWAPDGSFLIYSEPLQGGTSVTKAVTPSKAGVPFPAIEFVYTTTDPYRFANDGKSLIVLRGASPKRQDFYWVDLETGRQRQLTSFKTDFVIRNFDITPDGQQIVFERMRNNSDILLFELRK
jgi:Tol biopolymer transport system component